MKPNTLQKWQAQYRPYTLQPEQEMHAYLKQTTTTTISLNWLLFVGNCERIKLTVKAAVAVRV